MIDPVCGKRMNRVKAHIVIAYEGVAYALCCPRCQAEFESSPATYARPGWGRRVKREQRSGRQNFHRRPS